MSVWSAAVVALVAYGAISAWADAAAFVRRVRGVDDEIRAVLARDERPAPHPRSVP